jgi:hypothetical protein
MSAGAPSDPMGSMGDGPRSGAPKVFVILLAILVVLLFVGLGALVFTLSGDDGGGEEEGSVEASTSEPAEEDEADDDEEAEDEVDEPDADDDGLPDSEDTDDDGDGQPDSEDTDDDGDGVPDGEEPGDGGEEPGDGGEAPGDGGEEPGDGGEEPGDGDGGEEPDPGLNLLTNSPRPAIDAWTDIVGGNAKAIEVLLYPTYGFLQVRDPDKPQQVLDFGWRDGVTEGPEPADVFPGTDLDAESFRMNAVNWDALPRLVANAPERAHLPQGEVTHVIVTSDLPFSPRFIFRIYVTAPHGSDYVVATIDGQPARR